MLKVALLFFLLSASAHAETLANASKPVALESEQSHLVPLNIYKPLYFLLGNPYTKIQISFEVQLFKDLPVYFGYTELMMWNVFISKPYFYDLDYDPLVWYRFNLNNSKSDWLDLVPIEHESNGKGGAGERGWNRLGIAYHRTQTIGDKTILADVKAWYPINYNSNNPDLVRYRGLWELTLTAPQLLGPFFGIHDLIFRIYPGGPSTVDPFRGGQELTLRMRNAHRTFLPYLTFQVFHGFGEYLQDYDLSKWEFRAGVSF